MNLIQITFNQIRLQTSIFVSLFIIVLYLTSCTPDNGSKGTPSEIFIYQNLFDTYNTSQFIDSVKYIALETTENCIIGNISKLVKTEDRIYILDSKSAKKLFVFDNKGKFLHSIGSSGKGPGQYQRPVDFSVDIKNEFVLIIDSDQKILKTDLEGNLILEKKMPTQNRTLTNIEASNGFIYAYTGQRPDNEKKYQIIQLSDNLIPVNWRLPYNYTFPASLSFNNVIYTFNDTINFLSIYSNTLFQNIDGNFEARYLFNFNGKELQLEGLTFEQFLQNKTNAYFFQSCVEGKDVIYIPVFDQGRPKYGFLQKGNDKFMLIDEINEDSVKFFPPISYYKNNFISTIRSDLFLKYLPGNNLKPIITDNPIIVEYQIHFKEEN